MNVATQPAVDRTRVSVSLFVWDESAREQGVNHFHRLLAEFLK